MSVSIYSASEDIEQQRLVKQNNVYNLYANQYLDEIFEEIKEPVVLDIGCSNGINTMKRMEGRSYKHIIGIEYDMAMVDQARDAYDSEKAGFLQVDLRSGKLIQEVQKYLDSQALDGVDIIMISSVLLHLDKPYDVIRDCYKLLKKGGIILVQDEDDSLNYHTCTRKAFFDNCFYIWDKSKESGYRQFGFWARMYLREAGFDDIELKSSVIKSEDLDRERREDLWDLYFNSDYWVVGPEDFDEDDAWDKVLSHREVHHAYKEAYMNEDFDVTIGVVFLVGRK